MHNAEKGESVASAIQTTQQGISDFRGDVSLPTEDHLIVVTTNGSQGLKSHTRWSDILETAKDNRADIMVISEPGRHVTEDSIKWATHKITPGETDTRS